MDTVTTAIIDALSAAASGASTEIAKRAISEGYEGLKDLLKKKFGPTSDVAAAVDNLESKPDSDGRQKVLAEELSAAGAPADAELVSVASALLEQIRTMPGNTPHVQMAHGNNIAQADRGGTATVNVTGWQGEKAAGSEDD